MVQLIIVVDVYEEGALLACKEGARLRKSREFSLLMKLLDLSANQSKIMRVQEEALAHLLIKRQTHFTLQQGEEEEVTLELTE